MSENAGSLLKLNHTLVALLMLGYRLGFSILNLFICLFSCPFLLLEVDENRFACVLIAPHDTRAYQILDLLLRQLTCPKRIVKGFNWYLLGGLPSSAKIRYNVCLELTNCIQSLPGFVASTDRNL